MVRQVNTLMRESLEFEYEPTTEIKNIVAAAELDEIPSLEAIAIRLSTSQSRLVRTSACCECA
jgi:transcription initiation factor TFIID TATA-box-binding protein